MNRRTTTTLAVLLSAGLIAGCTEGEEELPTPDASSESPSDSAGPALDQETMQVVLDGISTSVEEADEAQDPELLRERVMGPALRLRSAEYRIAEATGGTVQPDPLSLDTQVDIVGGSQEYPRVAMAVSQIPDGSNLPLLLTLATSDVRDNYRLWSWVELFPGATVPETLSPDVGADALTPDDDSLALSPAEVVDAYAQLISDPEGSQADTFAPDEFRSDVFAETAGLNEAVSAAGNATVSAEPVVDGPLSLQTVEGGAIVVGVIRTTTTVTKTEPEGTLTVGGVFGDLLGNDGVVEDEVSAIAQVSVAFHVPSAEAEDQTIEVLGATSVLTEAVASGQSVVESPSESPTESGSESASEG
ncbi:hypothetical protein ACPYO6_08980 [Georgenia sp. Z1344]|uniref:hypothetical protein n=1 Tax=Georgenia sp. Z1344 TaxID=3416706 RepID=UPI003CF76917